MGLNIILSSLQTADYRLKFHFRTILLVWSRAFLTEPDLAHYAADMDHNSIIGVCHFEFFYFSSGTHEAHYLVMWIRKCFSMSGEIELARKWMITILGGNHHMESKLFVFSGFFQGNLVVFLSVNLGVFPETHLLKALLFFFPIFHILKQS